MTQRYFGNWENTGRQGMIVDFDIPDESAPPEDHILAAGYHSDGYEGDAHVVFRGPNGDLYEVVGSHCSCMGLEDQWKPELTSVEALRLRRCPEDHGIPATAWEALLTELSEGSPTCA